MINKDSKNVIQVFCYGSNMSQKRITSKHRCPSAAYFSTAKLKGYRLVFNKVSTDGSSKANLLYTGQDLDFVLGIIYLISILEKKSLDIAEGKGHGYDEATVTVKLIGENKSIFCQCFIATNEIFLSNSMKPYDWYMEHCIRGAIEFNLQEEYIEILKAVPFDVDKNDKRAEGEMSIYLS